MGHWTESAFVDVMHCRLLGAMPLLAKYECHQRTWQVFCWIRNIINEKIAKGTLVTPIPRVKAVSPVTLFPCFRSMSNSHIHIEAETKRAPFSRRQFKWIFLNENAWISIVISLKVFLRAYKQYSSIGSDNGLAPTRRQIIIWTNDGIVYWNIYASLGPNVLTFQHNVHIFYMRCHSKNHRSEYALHIICEDSSGEYATLSHTDSVVDGPPK